MREKGEEALFDHRARPGKAEKMVVGEKPRAPQTCSQSQDPGRIKRLPNPFRREGTGENSSRLQGNAHRAHAELPSDRNEEPCDRRVEMHVLMGVDVIEGKPGCAKGGKLRPDFPRERAANRRQEEKPQAGGDKIVGKGTFRRGKPEAARVLGNGLPVDENEVKADPQPRQPFCPAHRIGCGGACYHEACRGKDAVAVGLLDGLVDRLVLPEIVGGDDKALQLAISRLLRNWKNSIPSRSRRPAICGLLIISARREAILLRRK